MDIFQIAQSIATEKLIFMKRLTGDKGIQLKDSIKTYAYGTSKDLENEKKKLNVTIC